MCKIIHFDLLPWQLKVQNAELSVLSCWFRWTIVAHGPLVYKNQMGPPADKRDLTTFYDMLSNTHLKSVKLKKHIFLLSRKESSFMHGA